MELPSLAARFTLMQQRVSKATQPCLCSFKTKRANHLSKHLALHSKIQTIVSCDRCDFKCLRQADLAKHVRRVHQSSTKEEQGDLYQQTAVVHRCNQCFYEARSLKVLENHKSTKHSSSLNGQIFECQRCSYKTPKAITYDLQQRIDNPYHKVTNLSSVEIYLSVWSMAMRIQEEVPLLTLQDFIGSVGGSLGMFFGFSMSATLLFMISKFLDKILPY